MEYSPCANGFWIYLTLMSVESEGSGAIKIKALYYGQDGSLIATHTVASDFNPNTRLEQYGKFSTNASLARDL